MNVNNRLSSETAVTLIFPHSMTTFEDNESAKSKAIDHPSSTELETGLNRKNTDMVE